MDAYLDAHAPAPGAIHISLHANGPSITAQAVPRLDDHVADQLAAVHERGAERLGAGPRLGAAAVEVHARDEGRGQGGGAGELEGLVGAELEDRGGLDALG